MKICPVCKSRCFDDMDTCYGCMYKFNQDNNVSTRKAANQLSKKNQENCKPEDIKKTCVNKKENQAAVDNNDSDVNKNNKPSSNEKKFSDKKILCNNLNLNIMTNNNKAHKKPRANKHRIADYFELDDFPIVEDTNYFYKRRNKNGSFYVNSKKDLLAYRNLIDSMANKYFGKPNLEKDYQISIKVKRLNDGGHLLKAYLPKISFD